MFIRNSRLNTRDGDQIVEFFDGFVISYSRIYQPYFQTNFYAKRIIDETESDPNVIRRSDVNDPIIEGHLFEFKIDVD